MKNKCILAIYGDVDHELDLEYIKKSYTQIEFINYDKFIESIELNDNNKLSLQSYINILKMKNLANDHKLYIEEIVFYYLCDKELIDCFSDKEFSSLKQLLLLDKKIKPLNIVKLFISYDGKIHYKYLTIEEANKFGTIIKDTELANLDKNKILSR